MTTKAVNKPHAVPKGSALRRNYLSALENVAQAVGTMGPAATLGTVIPLLIAKTGNGTWLLFLGILGVFLFISININVFASRFASAGSLSSYAEIGLGRWTGVVTGWSYIVAMTFIVTSSVVACAYYLGMVMAHFTNHPIAKAGSILLTLLVVVLAWLPSYRDIKLSTNVMLCTEAISVGVIVLIPGSCHVTECPRYRSSTAAPRRHPLSADQAGPCPGLHDAGGLRELDHFERGGPICYPHHSTGHDPLSFAFRSAFHGQHLLHHRAFS